MSGTKQFHEIVVNATKIIIIRCKRTKLESWELGTGNTAATSHLSLWPGGAWAGEPDPMCFPEPQTDRRRMFQFGRKTKGIFIRKTSESQCSYAVALFFKWTRSIFKKWSDLPVPFPDSPTALGNARRGKDIPSLCPQLKEGLLHCQAPPTPSSAQRASVMITPAEQLEPALGPASQQASNSPRWKNIKVKTGFSPLELKFFNVLITCKILG